MPQAPLNDLAYFAIVAQERSFTRAARLLGMSPSALSHAMRSLEDRLGVRLLARTTRSVAPTEAGQRLLTTLRPALADIHSGLADLRAGRDEPAGTVRITAVKHAVQTLIMPMLPAFAARHPAIRVEIDVDDGFADIVAAGYDAGIRFDGSVDKDMIAVRIGPELEVAVVASPGYLADRGTPATPGDLARHRCILHRRPGGGSYGWPFELDGKTQELRPDGALAFNDSELVLDAALAGQGVACVFDERAAPLIAGGRLVRLLDGRSARLPGYALYYASRRQNPPALARFVDAVRGL